MDLLLQCYQNIVGEKRQKFCLNTEKAEEKKGKTLLATLDIFHA